MKLTLLLEGAAAVGGIALEIGGYAAKALGEKALELAGNPQDGASIAGKSRECLNKTADWLRAHPAAVCGTAFGVGLLCAAHFRFRKACRKEK
ncbi:MAG: hypothetical protein LBQ16_07385 [Gracilibacteraceae bacterium]|nr:hypothetical protein [Gracilibacteraceae bacterium]